MGRELNAGPMIPQPKAGASNGASVRGTAVPKDASIIVRPPTRGNGGERRSAIDVLVGCFMGNFRPEWDSTVLKCH
jgi:hypothetical protein